MIGEDAARLRRDYEAVGLDEEAMEAEPVAQFKDWFAGVLDAGIDEPNAFVLGTADADGRPSARAVLMKDLSPDGIVFYTGLDSRKSRDLRANGRAAATFVWTPLHRQVRFEGSVEEIDESEADAYFASRPRGAQVSAHASRQSEVVADRDELERRYRELDASLGDEVPRPAHWGGWRIVPDVVEFWQGRPNRFHDRIRYTLEGGVWIIDRLSP